MPIYLYVKTHRKTGLKYLGKTEQDPFKYRGSGTRWNNHLNTHGNDVETQILKECQTTEELKEYGLYYSKLWNVVESDDWANLMEEKGDGVSSETAIKTAKVRVEKGTHHFLDRAFHQENNKKRIENGTHNFLNSEFQKNTQLKRIKNGTHPFLDGEIQREVQKKKVENGTHNFLGGELSRKINKERVENGTHHFLGGEIARKSAKERIEKGTHNFLDSEFQRNVQFDRIKNGTHPSQVKWTCKHCGKLGNGVTNYKRWHGINCKSLTKEISLTKNP